MCACVCFFFVVIVVVTCFICEFGISVWTPLAATMFTFDSNEGSVSNSVWVDPEARNLESRDSRES